MGEQIQALEPVEAGVTQSSAAVDQTGHCESKPFDYLRARIIIGGAAVAFVLAAIIQLIASTEGVWGKSERVQGAAFLIVFHIVYALFIGAIVCRSGLNPRVLFGPLPSWRVLWRHALMAVPLQIFSAVLSFFFLLLLSYLAPGFVKSWFIDGKPTFVWASGEGYVLANVLSFISVVITAPVLEEFVFRGLLLTRWTLKWSLQTAIILSSALFAVGHLEIVGAFAFGYIFALVYVRTKSLFTCIAVHSANNLLAWTLMAIAASAGPTEAPPTIQDLQSGWWVGLIFALIVAPWAIKLARQHHEILSMGIPYVASIDAPQVEQRIPQQQATPSIAAVLVLEVKPESAAAEVGIMPGDAIVQYDGVRGLTSQRLGALVASARFQGGMKRIVFLRNGTEHSAIVRPVALGISARDLYSNPSLDQADR